MRFFISQLIDEPADLRRKSRSRRRYRATFQDILAEDRPILAPEQATTAVFYSYQHIANPA